MVQLVKGTIHQELVASKMVYYYYAFHRTRQYDILIACIIIIAHNETSCMYVCT